MIAGCPKCSARYRVDAEKIGPNGAKLRCTKCSAVFLVRAPRSTPAVETTPVAAASRSTDVSSGAAATNATAPGAAAVSSPAQTPAAAAPARPSPQTVDRTRLVLVADPDEARGKASAEAIAEWGLLPHLVLDGVEAMLAIQRMLPAAVVLDAALPKMFGFQVCEVVKRNESLKDTLVVLVGAIHDRDRYRRDPSDLYGADVYIEEPDLPDALRPLLERAGLPMGDPSPVGARSGSVPVGEDATQPAPAIRPSTTGATPTPVGVASPAGERATTPRPAAAPSRPVPAATPPAASAPAPVAEDPERDEERERARRLARIAVSEMILYHPDKFDAANRAGTLEQVLDLEIQEARALIRQRISEDVRAETDFVMDELRRVARDRREQA
ncbi:MAG: zinc-ribbon domain-containing protein [Myxococcales bacterium]|nr:zinc-ribbon domain-containing protein [Myxococcales bacterium]